MKRFIFFCLFILGNFKTPITAASDTHILKRTLIAAKKRPSALPETYIKNGSAYLYSGHPQKALRCFFTVITHFKNSPCYREALFLAGKTFMEIGEADRADKLLNNYLDTPGNTAHFEEVFQIKYAIAESYRQHNKRHVRIPYSNINDETVPLNPAILIYDQISSIMPNNKTAAMALYRKGCLLQEKKQYEEALNTFQELITQFRFHSLAPKAFLNINEIYLSQITREPQNPYILPQAELSLKLFQEKFPGSQDLHQAEGLVTKMKEVLATALFNTGKFYENKHKNSSSLVYYRMLEKMYPESQAAQKARARKIVIKDQKRSSL